MDVMKEKMPFDVKRMVYGGFKAVTAETRSTQGTTTLRK
jgi:hypothetical protein